MRKQSIKRGVWTIGRRKPRKQRGGFFPIGALAGPILSSIASNLAGPLLKKLIGEHKKDIDADDDITKMARDNILWYRRAVSKKVTLPNGRTFYAKYERVSHKHLPRNITVRRTTVIGPRRQRRQREA